MPTDVLMPKLADTLVEGTLARWLKAAHDAVKTGEAIAEIETDKVTTELTAPSSGTLGELLVAEGQTVPVGTPLARILPVGAGVDADAGLGGLPRPTPGNDMIAGAQGDASVHPTTSASTPAPTQIPAKRSSPLATRMAGAGVDADAGPGGLPRPTPGNDMIAGGRGDASVLHTTSASTPAPTQIPAKRSSPLATRMAEAHGVDLSQVQTASGRITRTDIERHLSQANPTQPISLLPAPPRAKSLITAAYAPASTPARPPADTDSLLPLTGLRRVTAQRMALVHQIPTGSAVVEADMTALEYGYRKGRGDWLAREGFPLTYTPYFIQALAQSLRAWPPVRLSYTNGQPEPRDRVHVGVAVALEDGLIVPVLRDADQKDLVTLAREQTDLVARARAHRLRPEEVTGGVATLTNVGSMGALLALPMLNENQTVILGMGAITRRAVSAGDGIQFRSHIYLSLTFDRRVLDDLQAERFLLDVAKRIEMNGNK